MDLLILSLLTRVFCYLSLLARDAFSLPFLAPLKLPIRNWTPWQKGKRYDMMKNGLNPLGLKWYKQRAISVWNSFEINPNHCELQRLSHFFKNVNLIRFDQIWWIWSKQWFWSNLTKFDFGDIFEIFLTRLPICAQKECNWRNANPETPNWNRWNPQPTSFHPSCFSPRTVLESVPLLARGDVYFQLWQGRSTPFAKRLLPQISFELYRFWNKHQKFSDNYICFELNLFSLWIYYV